MSGVDTYKVMAHVVPAATSSTCGPSPHALDASGMSGHHARPQHTNASGTLLTGLEKDLMHTQRAQKHCGNATWAGLCALISLSIAMPSMAQTVTQFSYDAGDHVTKVTDPRNLVTTYAYDGLGQLWQQTSPDTGTTRWTYDAYGRVSTMTRADGVQTTYGYDQLNRTLSITATGKTQTFTYDACTHGLGRLCAAADATGTTSYSYSPEGWITGRGFSINGATYALGYGYNALGQVASIVYPDGNQVIYSYTRGVVSGVTLNVGGSTITGASGITYEPTNAGMSSWSSSNGIANSLNYDTDGRLTGINATGAQNLSISYDAANRIVGLTNGIDSAMSQSFGYDEESRLRSVQSDADNQNFQYDANGNRLTQIRNGASTTYTISPNSNQLTNVSGAFAASYGYTPQGNTASVNGSAVYQYNAFDRFNATGSTANYVNPEGQRLAKSGGLTGTTYFAQDVSGALMAEEDNGIWIDYVWLNGRLVGRMTGTLVYAIHDDQTGRPEAVTDAGGTMVWRAQNSAFDRTVVQDSIGGLNLGFPGQYYDAETDTWNNGFRDYNAKSGRYIESDPFGLVGGPNTYAYAKADPINRVDPLGLDDTACMLDRTNCGLGSPGTPDYVHVSISYLVGTAAFYYSKNGTFFFSPGIAKPDPWSLGSLKNIGLSVTAGKMTGCPKTGSEVDNFLTGVSHGVSGFYVVGGGVTYNAAGAASEGGVGTPGYSLQALENAVPIASGGPTW